MIGRAGWGAGATGLIPSSSMTRSHRAEIWAWSSSWEMTAVALFGQFMSTQSQSKELHEGSLCRYKATLKHLERYFSSKSADLIDQADAEGFAQYGSSELIM
jgi:hypothetical protein